MKRKIDYCKQFVDLSDVTLRAYVTWINRLCQFAGKKSTAITAQDIEAFRLSLTDLSPKSHAVAYAAINTIYRKVLWPQMPEDFKKDFNRVMRGRPKQPNSMVLTDTEILSEDQIKTWLTCIEDPMVQLCASMTYYLGAKLSEACVVKLKDVKHQHVEINKRCVLVSDELMQVLKKQQRTARKLKSRWLFPSHQNPVRHVSTSSVQKKILTARPDNINSGCGVRALRASYIVHQIKKGVDPNWLSYSVGISGPGGLIPYMKLIG